MRRFFKKLLVIALCCYLLLFVLQMAVDAGVKRSSDDFTASNLLFEGQIKDRMVIVGNSRAQAHFDPAIIERKTGIAAYNLGTPGANLNFERIKWNSLLAHHRPQIVVQNIDLHALSDENVATKKFYLPYYDEPEMYETLREIDPTVRLEKWIPMSKYRGFEPLVLDGIAALFGKHLAYQKIKGYHRQTQGWNTDFDKFKKNLKGKPVDYSKTDFEIGFERLQQKINDCKKRNIRLILVWTPQYDGLTELQQPTFSKMKTRVANVARKNGIVFWDFSTSSMTSSTDYFYNSFHMNANGAAVFGRQFADSLNTLQLR